MLRTNKSEFFKFVSNSYDGGNYIWNLLLMFNLERDGDDDDAADEYDDADDFYIHSKSEKNCQKSL